jgi:hypothetical protein
MCKNSECKKTICDLKQRLSELETKVCRFEDEKE